MNLSDERDTAGAEIDEVHVDALMAVVHDLTSAGASRPTNELTTRQRLVVQTLGLHGPAAIAAVGSRLGLSPSTMTGIVDRLEELGVLCRRPHPGDRRVTIVHLTPRGEDHFRRERDFYGSLLEGALAGLEPTAVRHVLRALAEIGGRAEVEAA